MSLINLPTGSSLAAWCHFVSERDRSRIRWLKCGHATAHRASNLGCWRTELISIGHSAEDSRWRQKLKLGVVSVLDSHAYRLEKLQNAATGPVVLQGSDNAKRDRGRTWLANTSGRVTC
jgi:hypothetical protein